MQAKLVVITGKTSKRIVDLALPTVIGRSRGASLTVAHPMVSRRHCEIFEQDGVAIVRDLGSLNGTMLGGRRIEMAALLPDSEFTIGPISFRIHYEYSGDLGRVPVTKFVDEEPSEQAEIEPIEDAVEQEGEVALDFEAIEQEGDVAPDVEAIETPEEPRSAESAGDEDEIPGFMDWADAEAGEDFPGGEKAPAVPPKPAAAATAPPQAAAAPATAEPEMPEPKSEAAPAPEVVTKPASEAATRPEEKSEPDFVDDLPDEFWDADVELPAMNEATEDESERAGATEMPQEPEVAASLEPTAAGEPVAAAELPKPQATEAPPEEQTAGATKAASVARVPPVPPPAPAARVPPVPPAPPTPPVPTARKTAPAPAVARRPAKQTDPSPEALAAETAAETGQVESPDADFDEFWQGLQ